MKKIGYIFGIFIGLCMFGIWGMLLFTGQVKEITDEPFRVAAHLFSEAITAVLLILGGLLALRRHGQREKLHLVSLGMLMYSVLTAAGYYIQLNNIVMAIMFGMIFIATTITILANLLVNLCAQNHSDG